MVRQVAGPARVTQPWTRCRAAQGGSGHRPQGLLSGSFLGNQVLSGWAERPAGGRTKPSPGCAHLEKVLGGGGVFPGIGRAEHLMLIEPDDYRRCSSWN